MGKEEVTVENDQLEVVGAMGHFATPSGRFPTERESVWRTYVISFSEVFDFKPGAGAGNVRLSLSARPETDNNRQQDMLLVVPWVSLVAWAPLRAAGTATCNQYRTFRLRFRLGTGMTSCFLFLPNELACAPLYSHHDSQSWEWDPNLGPIRSKTGAAISWTNEPLRSVDLDTFSK
uniref:Uncharacterized protein n=1 Tax=Anopheles culicifacies TaxID=139723 RepID=A0A182MVM5_9DIPT